MNDFTKEELLTMRQCLRMAYKSGFNTDDGLPTAFYCYDKIQYMIENYCEHNERVATSDENGHMLVMCGRCYQLLWHEKD